MTSRKDIFNKYYVSDIFNRNPEFGNKEVKPKIRLNHSSLDITKEDVFNIGKEKRIQRDLYKIKNESNDKGLTQSAIKRKKDLQKIYGSDIFHSRKASSVERRRCKQHIESNIHKSSLFNDPKNNEAYIKELKLYSKEHRGEKKNTIQINILTQLLHRKDIIDIFMKIMQKEYCQVPILNLRGILMKVN